MKLIYFKAKWCAACKASIKTVEEYAKATQSDLEIIDTDENSDIATEMRVMGLPTLIIQHNGSEQRLTGAITTNAIERAIEEL